MQCDNGTIIDTIDVIKCTNEKIRDIGSILYMNLAVQWAGMLSYFKVKLEQARFQLIEIASADQNSWLHINDFKELIELSNHYDRWVTAVKYAVKMINNAC